MNNDGAYLPITTYPQLPLPQPNGTIYFRDDGASVGMPLVSYKWMGGPFVAMTAVMCEALEAEQSSIRKVQIGPFDLRLVGINQAQRILLYVCYDWDKDWDTMEWQTP